MSYTNPRNIFQDKISNAIKRERDNIGILEHIFKLQQIYSLERKAFKAKDPAVPSWEVMLEVYNFLGREKFAELIHIIGGNTVVFPSEEEYQDSLITALCYYYREIDGNSWDQVKNRLEISNLNNIKYSIRLRDLKGFIDSGVMKRIKSNG